MPTPALVMMLSQAQPGDRLWFWEEGWEMIATVTRLSLHVFEVTTESGQTIVLEDRLVVIGRDA